MTAKAALDVSIARQNNENYMLTRKYGSAFVVGADNVKRATTATLALS